jgi:hypothetical protein
MLLSGRGTTRIKRGHRIWPNHTPRSMSIQWDTVLFGRMGSPNIYIIAKPCQEYGLVGKSAFYRYLSRKKVRLNRC